MLKGLNLHEGMFVRLMGMNIKNENDIFVVECDYNIPDKYAVCHNEYCLKKVKLNGEKAKTKYSIVFLNNKVIERNENIDVRPLNGIEDLKQAKKEVNQYLKNRESEEVVIDFKVSENQEITNNSIIRFKEYFQFGTFGEKHIGKGNLYLVKTREDGTFYITELGKKGQNISNARMFGCTLGLTNKIKEVSEVVEKIETKKGDIENAKKQTVKTTTSKEVKKEKESTQQTTATTTTTENTTDITITYNEEKNGIELSFSEKPSEEIRSQLKSNGFRWSKFQKIWFAKDTEERRNFVNSLLPEQIDFTEEVENMLKEDEITFENNTVEEVATTTEQTSQENLIQDEEIQSWDRASEKYELINFDNIEVIETLDKNIFVNCLVPSLNKNCRKEINDNEIKESSTLEKFKIQKIVKLSEKQYNYFINNLLSDYDFLQGLGGWETDNNEYDGTLLYFYGVAVICDNKETLIIDPSGTSYCRYTCQLVEDINNALQGELNNINTNIIINNSLYNEAMDSIINDNLYEIKASNKTVINDNRYIKNIEYNGITVVTGLTIKELIAEGKGINILNLQPLKIDLNIFKEGLIKHDTRQLFSLMPSPEDIEIEKIKFMDRLEKELDRAKNEPTPEPPKKQTNDNKDTKENNKTNINNNNIVVVDFQRSTATAQTKDNWKNEAITKKQLYALYCITKVKTTNLQITKGKASELISKAKKGIDITAELKTLLNNTQAKAN